MSRPALINRRSNNELKQMSDLNNRFVNFIQLVKSETIRGEELQQSLVEEKEKHFADFKQSNRNYLEKLNSVKKYLNDMCVDVCEELVKEKHNRILADWYEKLAQFEESLSTANNTIITTTSTTTTTNSNYYNQRESGVNTSGVLNSSGYFETSSPCSNSYVNSSDFVLHGGLFLGASELTLVEQGSPPIHSSAAAVSATIAVTAAATTPINLSNLSATMSSSQSSLNSCSSSNFSISPSSSSSSSSSAYTSSTNTATTTTTTRQSVLSASESSSEQHFSLEVYLSALNKQKVQLNDDYERKVAECTQLKQNIVELNGELNGLNDNLDNVKVDNVKLNDDIKQLRREIDFLRELYKNNNKNSKTGLSRCSSEETTTTASNSKLIDLDVEILEYDDEEEENEILRSSKYDKLESIEIYEEEEMRWVREEIAAARAEAEREYEEFTTEQLNAYECELESELMGELERLENELWPANNGEPDESDEILDELIELNAQLVEDFAEFESLMRINADLNDRLIQLSSLLIEFNSMSKDKQERMIVNYSIVSLRKENESRRSQVKELKQELSTIKSQLIQNDAFDLIISSENQQTNQIQSSSYSISQSQSTFEAQTTQTTSSISNNSESTSSMLTMNNSSSQLNWNSRINILQQQELLLKELDEIKCAFHIRPYCAQIEYTKSKLFAYFVIKFDIIYHMYAPPQPQQCQQNSSSSSTTTLPPKIAVTNSNSVNKNNCILNCLKIVYDSIDGHSILIENNHRILDIDLSEWTLKREIYQIEQTTLEKIIEFGLIDQNNQDAPTASSRRCKPDHCIEYKFPKGFRLKRRKKINLIAAGNKQQNIDAKSSSSSIPSQQNLLTNRPQTPSMIPRLNTKLSISCNSLNGASDKSISNSTKPSKLPIRRPIKPSCSSMSLNNSNNISNKRDQVQTTASTTRSKCSCCACKTMTTTRRGDVEFFEVEEVSNWGSGILVLTKLINTKSVTKMVNYRYLKHIWVNNSSNTNHEKDQNLHNNTVVFDTDFPDDFNID